MQNLEMRKNKNTKITIPETLHWLAFPDNIPTTDDMMIVITRTKAGVYGWNRAYYDNGSWHGSGSMSGVIAWAAFPIIVEDI